MKKWIAIGILAVLVIGMVLMSGCTSSQSTAPAAPITSQPISDRELIQQGIANAETKCIGQLPRGASTDKCIINSINKEKIIDSTILKLKEKEQDCLKDLPRSKDIILCSVSASDKIFIGEEIAFRHRVFRNMNITESIDKTVDNRVDGWIFLPYRS